MRLLIPILLAALLGTALPASAGLSVTGDAADVTVDAQGATLREIVDALAKQTGMTIDLEGSDDMAVDGAFQGPVEEVLTRILRNMSFVISALDDAGASGLRVQVLGEGVAPIPPMNLEGEFDPMAMPPEQPPDDVGL